MTETQDEHELKALLQEGYSAPPPRDAFVASLRAKLRSRFTSLRETAPPSPAPVPSPVTPVSETSSANLHARIAVAAAAIVVALVFSLSGRQQPDVEVAAAPKKLAPAVPQPNVHRSEANFGTQGIHKQTESEAAGLIRLGTVEYGDDPPPKVFSLVERAGTVSDRTLGIQSTRRGIQQSYDRGTLLRASARLDHQREVLLRGAAEGCRDLCLDVDEDAEVEQIGGATSSRCLRLAKGRLPGVRWNLIETQRGHLIQAQSGKTQSGKRQPGNFAGWYLDFDDDAEIEEMGGATSSRNLLLTEEKVPGAYWRVTQTGQGYLIQAQAGRFQGWYLDLDLLTKQEVEGAFWRIEPAKTEASQPEETPWGKAVDGVQCRLRSEKSTWKVGQTPKIHADLRNRGRRKLSMALYPTSWEIQYDGIWYHVGAEFSGIVGVLHLDPGGHRDDIAIDLEDRWRWLSKKDSLRLVFRPGKHTLHAAFRLRAGDGSDLRVVSNPVEIEIVAEQPAAGPVPPSEQYEQYKKTAWGKPVDGVQCRLLPQKSTWQAGQTPRLQADLRNRGKRKVNLGLAPENWEVQCDGVWYRSTTVTLGLVGVLNLEPGAQKDGISLQLGDFWGWRSKDKNLALVFRPGKHALRVAFRVRGVSAPVASKPVEIEILTDEKSADTQPAANVPFGWMIHAAQGRVKQVACDPALALDGNAVPARAGGFVAPPEDSGTVHPDAIVALLGSDRLPIAVAVDSRKADATDRDVLRFNFSGKEQFAGKPVVPLRVSRRWDDSIENVFGPTTIQFKRGDTTIPVTVQGEYCKYGNLRRSLTVEIGVALEWQCRFGEKTHAVRLVDGNANFAFGDRATPSVKGGRVTGVSGYDTLAVDAGDGSFDQQVTRAYYGHPVLVDGVWYDVALSADGTQIAARPLNAETAQLKIPHEVWSARLAGQKYLLALSGSTEPVTVPADRYTVLQYRESTPPEEKERPGWFALTWISDSPGRSPSDAAGKAIDAAAGKTVEVALGTPLCGRITSAVDGRTVHLDFSVVDASGAPVNRVYLADDWPTAYFEILDADGKRVHSGRFAFC